MDGRTHNRLGQAFVDRLIFLLLFFFFKNALSMYADIIAVCLVPHFMSPTAFPILHGAEMWKRGHNNQIRDALVFIPFK